MDTTKIEQYIQDLYDGKIRITEVPYKYRNHDTYMAAHIFARTIADDTVRHDQYWKIASQLEDDVIQSEKEKDKEREESLMYTHEVSTPMRCIAPIEVVSKTEQSSERYLQELPIKGFVLEAVSLSSLEHKTNEPYADRVNKGLFTKLPIHWQMMPKEYFGLCFAFKARA